MDTTAAEIALKKMVGDAVLNTARYNLANSQEWLMIGHEAGRLLVKHVEPFLKHEDGDGR